METKFYMQMRCNSVRCQEFATIKKDYTSKKIIFHKKYFCFEVWNPQLTTVKLKRTFLTNKLYPF